MQRKNLIKEKLFGYPDFIRYCQESGKKFVDELDREDFIAYRAEYSVSRERVEQIKKILNFQEKKTAEEISRPQNIFNELDVADDSLGNFFDSSQKKIPTKILKSAEEELDEFLCDAALNHDPQIDLIISAFEKFSASVTLKNLFQNLPEEFKAKRVRHCLLACGLEKNNFFLSLPEELTLAGLAEYLAENLIDFDLDALKKFSDELNFDWRACAKEIFVSLFKDKREFDVVCRRAKGETLEEIGKKFSVTRERIRQIETKSVGKFIKHRNDAKKIFYFLHALTDGQSLLTLNDAKYFLEADAAEMLWFFVVKTNLSSDVFHFDEELNAVVFADENKLDEKDLIKNLPEIMEEKIFEETITNLAHEKNYPVELIKIKLSKIYRHSGKFFHRGRLTLTFECGYVLRERFSNGYKIGDEISYRQFVRYLKEIFDEKPPVNQRAFESIIGRIGFLCDRGKYIHPDLVHVSPEIMERVKNFIDGSERMAIFYKEIFETLKDFFIGTQITNHYLLQGAIKFYNLPYILRKDYLTKSDEIDMGKEFDSFVAERGEVSAQEIKKNFVSFKDFNI